jgi:hypothetical protein
MCTIVHNQNSAGTRTGIVFQKEFKLLQDFSIKVLCKSMKQARTMMVLVACWSKDLLRFPAFHETVTYL